MRRLNLLGYYPGQIKAVKIFQRAATSHAAKQGSGALSGDSSARYNQKMPHGWITETSHIGSPALRDPIVFGLKTTIG